MNADPADTRYPHRPRRPDRQGRRPAGRRPGPEAPRRLRTLPARGEPANLVAEGSVAGRAAAPDSPACPAAANRTACTGGSLAACHAGGRSAVRCVLSCSWGGAVTGLVHVHLSGPDTETALTAVIGCSQIEQADGRLEQVNGSSLVIKSASGQPVTVTTTASTFVSMSGPLLSDITDGASVMVRGHSSDGAIVAAIVTVGQPFSAVNPQASSLSRDGRSDASMPVSLRDRQRNPDPGDHLRRHARRHTPRQPGPAAGRASIFALGHAGPDGRCRQQGWQRSRNSGQGPTSACRSEQLLAQLDDRGARRDQRGARPRPLIRQTPTMTGATMSCSASSSRPR